MNSNGELDDLLDDPVEPPREQVPWVAPQGALQIEAYLRSVWGEDVYQNSAFAQLAHSEVVREQTLRARPKKGKKG